MPLPDDQKKRLDEQADDLRAQAGKHSGRDKEGYEHAAKLLKDQGFRKGLDALHDAPDAEALSDPRAFFKKHGADIPEGLDIRHKGRG
jgi:hypothetical protein